MDWLGVKKVEVHGMKTRRWTTSIKLGQYKGLVNLYSRDIKIAATDQRVKLKVLQKTVTKLNGDIEKSRYETQNVVDGDQQALRNALSKYPNFLLAYKNLPVTKAIEDITHKNFKTRKLDDRLSHSKKQKSEELINLKLQQAELVDQIKHDKTQSKIPVEIKCELVTGKVQDAILKREAALSLRTTYNKVLVILQKDDTYFDVVLNTLKIDACNQSKCVKNAIELGQMATEYIDERKEEYQELLRAVRRDRKAREASLKLAHQELDNKRKDIGAEIRRDSDINIGILELPRSYSLMEVETEFLHMDKILHFLKDCTFAESYESTLEVLKLQEQQRVRLEDLFTEVLRRRDSLINRTNHAETKEIDLGDNMLETTNEFIKEREDLRKQIISEKQRKSDAYSMLIHEKKRLAEIRSSLQNLLALTNGISRPSRIEVNKAGGEGPTISLTSLSKKKKAIAFKQVSKPQPMIEDAKKIIDILQTRFGFLSANSMQLDEFQERSGSKFYEGIKKIQHGGFPLRFEPDVAAEDEDFEYRDLSVPNYKDMKAISKEYVDSHSIDPDLIPMFNKGRGVRKTR